MGANFCGFRRRPRPIRSPEKDPENENCGLTESVMKFLKPRSLLASAMKVKQKQEKQDQLQLHKNNSKALTLEDLIISSPCFNGSEGEMPVHKQSSRRIHPSFDGDLNHELLLKSVEVEMPVSRTEGMDAHIGAENPPFCRTRSGKVKKKVSFRSPEVADVFVLDYSPEICMTTDE